MKNVLIIGGGAAGMMAAIFAAKKGAKVTLLERNDKLGKKLYITGKGRCNVTNDCDLDDFIKEVPRNPRFLYSALSFFSPQDMMAFLTDAGCPVVVERGRRVFPQSQRASDVTRTLERKMANAGIKVRLNARVKELCIQNDAVTGVLLFSGEMISADAVIVATGGKSYPMTGSTGDGYTLMLNAGHTITPLSASLSAIRTIETWPFALQGLSLKNIQLTLYNGKKKCYEEMGEMLFTHFGVSGPLVLEASGHLDAQQLSQYRLVIDLKPALSVEMLEARLLREFEAAQNKQLKSVLIGLLPGKLAKVFPEVIGFDDAVAVNQVSKALRHQIALGLKSLTLGIAGLNTIDEAIVTRGGVTVKEINAATMESKIVKGLFAIGELLDVDAHTGGYNLQIAFSTGALAGDSI